ncbi:uncharacterized protein MYCFIDRAFT_85401 [Pseudocercospora fijiensis CIRAD86]|uniref:YDG domain-containing protein n=1 Tax=Pseudocercospora fijiensis (strain CIRAD86) TaxID=383855 RepID=M3B175_PSEFD|nr:uncharacterized protein MYCFIDRAFT_85401 [Pseudocercospora fijiensis CIRAD86]EME83138.1 hypothetical protein MYCFIDRAFT_85401 [Pseudocercospora fijiensis CIRAD86]
MATTLPTDLQSSIDFVNYASRKLTYIALISGRENRVANMTPELKQRARVPRVLEVVFSDPKFQFPPEYKTRAEALYDKFNAENWGAPIPLVTEDSDPDSVADVPDSTREGEATTKRRKSTVVAKGAYTILQPAENHPVWGLNGIMHGITLRKYRDTGKYTKVLNPQYLHEKRNAKVYGHNGLEVGSWFPERLAAIFAGAHGARIAGISGIAETGACSIVISGMYEDLDQDEGDIVYYSGSGSHENKDKDRSAETTRDTNKLHTSIFTRRPVRVLRTSKARGEYAPIEGVRYDGLYEIVGFDEPINRNGGKYERFKLVRRAGQKSLKECKKRPTWQELKDFNQINFGFGGYRLIR